MNRDFINPATQAEKQEALQNERRLREADAPSCYFQMAAAGIDLSLSGDSSPASFVVGSTPHVNYPRSGYEVGVEVGVEPPTGQAVDAMEPVGTAAEIAASLPEEIQPAGREPAEAAALSDQAPVVDSAAVHARLNQLFREGIVRRKL
jgi:hypothetical protein